MKVSICATENGITHLDSHILDQAQDAGSDLLVLPEMPFGEWVSEKQVFDKTIFLNSIHTHERALEKLRESRISILTSQPKLAGGKRVNQAVLVGKGEIKPIHMKQHFPNEAGYWEAQWFERGDLKLNVFEIANIKCGVLLCTDAMFLEQARQLRSLGAQVIIVPRATTGDCGDLWSSTLALIAKLYGCYVLSANRFTTDTTAPVQFNGQSMAFSPQGELLATTSTQSPLLHLAINAEEVASRAQDYPVYLALR